MGGEMKKHGIDLKLLKNEDIGRWVEYENKNAKLSMKGRLVSWNTVNAFCVFGIKPGDKYINMDTTAVFPDYLRFISEPITVTRKKKDDE
jgi:hypothetical protein